MIGRLSGTVAMHTRNFTLNDVCIYSSAHLSKYAYMCAHVCVPAFTCFLFGVYVPSLRPGFADLTLVVHSKSVSFLLSMCAPCLRRRRAPLS